MPLKHNSDHLFNILFPNNEHAGGLPDREGVTEEYKWNLSDIFTSDDAWEECFSQVEKSYVRLKEYEGKLTLSAENLHALLLLEEEITVKLEQLYLYAMLSRDSDLRVSKYQGMDSRVKSLYTRVSVAASFVKPELLAADENLINGFIAGYEPLKPYAHFFDELMRAKQHTLSKELEELLSAAAEISGVPYDTFSIFTNADLKFGQTEDEFGNTVEVSHGRYQAALYSKDRSHRQRVYKAYYKPYMDYVNTLSTLFNGNLKSKIFYANNRKYLNAREASLDRNSIPVRVYDNLVNAVNRNLEPMHRWMALKKKLLNLDELHPYDVYTGIFSNRSEKHYSYSESIKLVKDSLTPLGPAYREILEQAFGSRWIDVYETKGKRSGAYSSGTTFGVHPYVLLNWNNMLNDVFTLAHEMGHNVHSYLTGKYQPFIYADYSIFLAEIASTFNESLLLDHLLKITEDKLERRELLERYLNNASATFYRQTMFAEFEADVYAEMEKGAAVTPETLCALYSGIYKRYMGPEMAVDKEEEYTWARVPHFYYNFYVFQYATGFAASEALASGIKSGGAENVNRYLSFLKAGKSDYPLNILKNAGVDMASEEPILAVANKMTAVLDELEASL